MPWKQIGGRWTRVDDLDDQYLYSNEDKTETRKAPAFLSLSSPGAYLGSPSSVSTGSSGRPSEAATPATPPVVKTSHGSDGDFSGGSKDTNATDRSIEEEDAAAPLEEEHTMELNALNLNDELEAVESSLEVEDDHEVLVSEEVVDETHGEEQDVVEEEPEGLAETEELAKDAGEDLIEDSEPVEQEE
mmetsp:Transcript_7327/g.12916  ORF Transcript_7327/g.12916 Transcript_7327/m.12916 type:complete len:188 (+) Transcript_7327:298-861(+)